jgi:hypothetical protein
MKKHISLETGTIFHSLFSINLSGIVQSGLEMGTHQVTMKQGKTHEVN